MNSQKRALQKRIPTINLFLALFPDRYSARQLTLLANLLSSKHGLQGIPIYEKYFHITLHGWRWEGHPSEDFVRAVIAAAEEAAGPAPPFEVIFDQIGSFPGSGALVLRSRNGNNVLQQFRAELGTALETRGVPCQSSFNPHVTLLYDKCIIHEESVDPVSWVVNEFRLVCSYVGETRYDFLGRGKLRG